MDWCFVQLGCERVRYPLLGACALCSTRSMAYGWQGRGKEASVLEKMVMISNQVSCNLSKSSQLSKRITLALEEQER